MSVHPTLGELVEASDHPDVQAHLATCGVCRARARMVASPVSPSTLPDLEAAREALADARRAASLSLGASWGSDPLAGPAWTELLPVGRTIDRYEVRERVGVGGMGAVYRVEHTTLGSSHALKVVHTVSPTSRERLIQEGRAQGRLQHPNVVPVTDVVDVDGAPGLVMAFVDGPSLARWLADHGAPPIDVVVRLGDEILRAVAAAHAAGIVHRDLKPSNVLIATTEEGPSARVCDFGLARGEDDAGGPSGPLGTPAYMAPEQILDAGRADARSDLFSVGAVLYELATGQRAFVGRDVAEVWQRIGSGAYVPALTVRPELPPHLVATLERALSVDPAARFADAAAMRAAWRGEGRVPAARGRWWALAAGGAVALALGLAFALARPQSPMPPIPTERVPATEAKAATDAGDRRLTALGEAFQIFAIALSPDGERLLYADSRGLWEQGLAAATPRRVFAGGPVHTVDWLDGREVLVTQGGEARGTWRLDLDSGDRVRVTSREGFFSRPAPDGARFALADEEGLWVLPLGGDGEPVHLREKTRGARVGALEWSPDGRHLVVLFAGMEGSRPQLVRIDAATGDSTVLLEDPRLVSLGLGAVTWLDPDRLVFARTDAEDGPAGLFVLDGASTAADAGAARRVRSWDGYQLIRLRAGGGQLIASRGTARQDVWALDPDDPEHPVERTPEAWNDRPVGWTDEGLWLVSDRGGWGLFVQSPEGEVRRVDTPGGFLVDTWDVGGGARLTTWLLRHEGEPALEVVREGDGATRRLWLQPVPRPVAPATRTEAVRCVGERCLLSHVEHGVLGFRWIDPVTGERSEPVASLPLEVRPVAWDLSPDATRVVAVVGHPSERVVLDLSGGEPVRTPLAIELPLSATHGPDGALYVAGATFDSLEPYRIVRIAQDGTETVLRSSVNTNYHSLVAAPDGDHLAVGVNAFGTDVWRLDVDLDGA